MEKKGPVISREFFSFLKDYTNWSKAKKQNNLVLLGCFK